MIPPETAGLTVAMEKAFLFTASKFETFLHGFFMQNPE